MMFKRPTDPYHSELEKFLDFLEDHKAKRRAIYQAKIDVQDRKEAEQYLRKIFSNLWRLFVLVEYSKNDYIPLDNPFMGWEELAVFRYGPLVGNWLIDQIFILFKEVDDPCTSNVTFCEVGNLKEEADYNNCTDCCGRANRTERHWLSGRRFRFGFNYGH